MLQNVKRWTNLNYDKGGVRHLQERQTRRVPKALESDGSVDGDMKEEHYRTIITLSVTMERLAPIRLKDVQRTARHYSHLLLLRHFSCEQ